MMHMTIACNILNALGGEPIISKPHFVPSYPTHLPMCIGDSLIVGLERYSRELVKDVFMKNALNNLVLISKESQKNTV
jgi:hypothetical protein